MSYNQSFLQDPFVYAETAGGIFCVDNNCVRITAPPDILQTPQHRAPAGFAYDISKKNEVHEV